MYCEDWVASNAGLDVGSMSSQRVSDLLASLGCQERNGFYRAWYEYILEREFVALDITSVSSYSERVGTVEWGHNRNNENQPQMNICMLLGEESRLPVYQTLYSGSLSDVTTLRSTMSEFSALTGATELMVVMDKGFFSANVLLSNHIDSAQTAHDIYRAKDVVEKGFLRYKNNLGLGRLRVHSDDRMQNKVFVAFIALIIASAIHHSMKREGLFKGMTFEKLLLKLAKL